MTRYMKLNMKSAEDGEIIEIPVKDVMPDLEMDVEGKFVVEVSLKFFIDLMRAWGFYPIEAEKKGERSIAEIVNGVPADE